MAQVSLAAKPRPEKTKAKPLLKEGRVPGIVYGHGFTNEAVLIAKKDLVKAHEQAGQSSLIELSVGEKEAFKVLIHDLQYDPVSDEPIHVDFYRVKMTEKIKTEIPLKFVGEAPAVEDLQGTLIQNKDELRVEALPQDLVHEIEVDISRLKTFEDKIHVKDLTIPNGIEVQEEPEEVVALVQPPRSEEELAALEEKVEEKVEDVAVEEKGKEDEEGEEGAEAAEGARTGASEITKEKPAPETTKKEEK
ncbi:50S ribosomal protein L25 [Candidatus Berkelbacteria bacterium]|nr:50S ribosomal protein L25 [Candidatus Berkelbacteria bacterium]